MIVPMGATDRVESSSVIVSRKVREVSAGLVIIILQIGRYAAARAAGPNGADSRPTRQRKSAGAGAENAATASAIVCARRRSRPPCLCWPHGGAAAESPELTAAQKAASQGGLGPEQQTEGMRDAQAVGWSSYPPSSPQRRATRCAPHFPMGIVELIQVGQPVNRAAVAEVPMKGAAKKRFDPLLAQVAGQDRGERGPSGEGAALRPGLRTGCRGSRTARHSRA